MHLHFSRFFVWLLLSLMVLPPRLWSLAEPQSVAQPAASGTLEAHPLVKKRAPWAIFFDVSGGTAVSTYDHQFIHPDISFFQSQSVSATGIGVSYYLLDGCQSEKPGQMQPCADMLLSAQLGTRYWYSSLFLEFNGRLGLEVDTFLGHQRIFALTAKVQFGLSLSFQVDTSVRDRYSIYSGNSTFNGASFLVFAGPGMLFNLGSFTAAKGLGIYLDTQFYTQAIKFNGFLASIGFRYRF